MPGTIRQRLRHRPFGRLLALAAVLGTVLLMMFGSVETVPAAEAATPSPFYFGTLITQPEHAAEESAKGVKVAMLELGWDSYEPTEGHFDAGYARTMKARYDALKAQGMQVTLALGLHYPPQWVFAFPNSRYVDQRGRTSPEVNLIFNQTLRSKAERYLARVDMDLGLKNFWAVRLTSGGDAEVLYPGGGSYWAFDQNAQNGPDLPPTMPRNPSPGWRPGDRSIST